MSQVQTLTYLAQEHADRHLVADQSAWPTDTSIEGFPSHTTENSTFDKALVASAQDMFPGLPPLLHGHPDVHMRAGVIEASRLASLGKPDSERAFFVADLSSVYLQHQRWTRCFPDIKPYYGPCLLRVYLTTLAYISLLFTAVKCNPDPYVLRLLASLGTGFDCASNGEINQVLRIGGVDPSRIIFANPCKAVSFVRSAAKSGVDMMTFDNADELHKISRTHPRAKLIIRILTDDSKSLCRLGIKFGAPLNTVAGLLARAKELKLDVIGVSFHVGSGCYDSTVFTDAIMRSRHVFDIAQDLGFSFTLLDVGGGFEDATFENTARILNGAIDHYFPDRQQLNIIAEPGRFYVSRAFSLAASVIARRAPMPSTEPDVPTGDQEAGSPNVMCMCPKLLLDTLHVLSNSPFFRLYQRRRVRGVQLHHVRPSGRASSSPLA